MKSIVVVCRRVKFGQGSGGMERASGAHIRSLRAAGWNVTVVAAEVDDVPHGVDVVKVDWPAPLSAGGGPTFGIGYAIWCGRVSNRIKRLRLPKDAIYLWHGSSGGALAYLSQPTSERSVVNPHGLEEFRRDWRREINRVVLRRLTRQGARRSRFVIATDSGLTADVQKSLRIPKSKVRIIPNVVDFAQLEKYGKSEFAEGLVVSVGRLVFNKGFDLLASALAEMGAGPEGPLRWIHHGSGPDESLIDSVLRDSSSEIFELKASATDSEVYSAMGRAQVVVVPSRFEGSSLVTLEALAIGTLVVGMPVGGIPDKIIDGATGFLSERVDSRSLAISLRRALSTPVLVRNRIINEGQRMIAQRFDSANIAIQWDRIREELVG